MLTRFLAVLTALLVLLGQVGAATELTLVAEDDWYPYSAERDGRARGFSVDVVEAAYAAVGVKVDFKVMSYSRCMELLDLGEEIGCFNTPEDNLIRQRQLFPDEPIDRNAAWVYALADYPKDRIRLAELSGRVVGIVNGYRYGDAFMADESIVRESAASDLQNLKKLAAHRLDFIILYERVARYLIGEYADELGVEIKPVAPIGEIALFVSFSRMHPRAPEAMHLLDAGMREIKRNGRYLEIQEQWDALMEEGRVLRRSAS